jgi:segregation and condensation protein B
MKNQIPEIDEIDDLGNAPETEEHQADVVGAEDVSSPADTRSRGAIGPQTEVTPELLRHILEGAILASAQPLTVARMRELFDEDLAPSKEEIQAALELVQADCASRGFELKEVASGWRFQVRENLAPWVSRLWEEKPQKYSRALLETLSLIAYRQPITRGDIEEIRGVAVSSHIMKTLMERDWVKVVGHRDVPGRPSLYATTRQFLDYFNLKSLDELPSLSEIRDLDDLNPMLNLGDDEGLGEKDTDAPIPDVTSETDVIEEKEVESSGTIELEEGFVDHEDAFEYVEDDAAPAAQTYSETNEDADKT